jgi:hypothetical protein
LSSKGLLLVDQLLVTGNAKNRYFTCQYSYGKVDISTAKRITPSDRYKQLTVMLLQKNIDKLEKSILTEYQQNEIKAGLLV